MTDAFDMGPPHRHPERAAGAGEAVSAFGGDAGEARLLEQIAYALGRQAAQEFLAGKIGGKEVSSDD